MSAANGNGNGRGGIVGAVSSVASRVVGALPSEFLGLVIITALFNVGMLYFFIRQGDARERVLRPLIEACANSVPMEALQLLYHPEKASH